MRVERELAPIARTSDATRRLLRAVVLVAMVVAGLLLCLDVAYFLRGSLETFPMDEQEEKIRVVTAALGAVLLASELGLWFVLRYLQRSANSRRSR